jgi:flagellar M-ring protein FliF
MVRERLYKLLTPLVGAGRFTAEVAADVDFSQNETASERYGPDSVLRSENASRAIDGNAPPARGIPGALSNTAPQAAQLTATPPAAAAPPAPAPSITNESTQRAWEIGKDVSVTRGVAPRVKRLSVAVVIDKADAKMSPQDVASLTRIVRGAIGYDAGRGDMVEVQLRAFAAPVPEPLQPWYEKPAVQDYAPMIGLAVLLLAGAGAYIWRSRKQAELAAAAATAAGAAAGGEAGTIDGGDLSPGSSGPTPRLVDYSEKLGTTRGLVDSDADRATAVARQMLATPS